MDRSTRTHNAPRAAGSYGNTGANGGQNADAAYVRTLKSWALEELGADTQLYTTDGGDLGYMTHGGLPGEIYAAGDGNGAGDIFKAIDAFNPDGLRAHLSPAVYPGWLTHWGEVRIGAVGAGYARCGHGSRTTAPVCGARALLGGCRAAGPLACAQHQLCRGACCDRAHAA